MSRHPGLCVGCVNGGIKGMRHLWHAIPCARCVMGACGKHEASHSLFEVCRELDICLVPKCVLIVDFGQCVSMGCVGGGCLM